jgi:hypothetical protein
MRTWLEWLVIASLLKNPAGPRPVAYLRHATGEGWAESFRLRGLQPRLAERHRQKAGTQQHETGRGQGKKSVGDDVVVAHVTPTTEMLVRIY